MLKNQDLARFVVSLLPTAIKKGLTHHVLLAFNAATLHDFIKRSKTINEGTVAYLLPALLEPLQQKPKKLSKDAVVSLDIGFFFPTHSCCFFSARKLYSSCVALAKV
jgi:U3 small nucleolar RNA-associated protein 10